jgi:DNA-binding transcriptional ArsR family regulator
VHLFAVLGDPVRFRIVEILASGSHLAGELTSAVIGDFGISRSAVSHQLRILRDEGIVEVHPDETRRIYRLRWNTLERVDRVLIDLYEKWDRRTGWPYTIDPLEVPVRRHRLAERSRTRVSDRKWLVEPLAPDDQWDDDEEEELLDDEPPGTG